MRLKWVQTIMTKSFLAEVRLRDREISGNKKVARQECEEAVVRIPRYSVWQGTGVMRGGRTVFVAYLYARNHEQHRCPYFLYQIPLTRTRVRDLERLFDERA
jgi:hypothetical protein